MDKNQAVFCIGVENKGVVGKCNNRCVEEEGSSDAFDLYERYHGGVYEYLRCYLL